MQTVFDQRRNNFDFIRLFLAILVIYSHSYALSGRTEAFELFSRLTRGQATGGRIAVDGFFIISGFLITASFERSPNLRNYFAKRVARIYPGFVCAMLVGVAVVLPLSGGSVAEKSVPAAMADFVVQTLRLHEFHYAGVFSHLPYPNVINGSMWSIPYEFWCYVGVAVLGSTTILRSPRALVALLLCSLAASYLCLRLDWKPAGGWLGTAVGYPPAWAELLPMYMAGVVFYRVRAHLALSSGYVLLACCALVAAARIPYAWAVVFPLAGSYLLLAFAFHPGVRLHGWSRYGDFSYGAYLYAFPVQQLTMSRIGHPVSAVRLFLVACPITLLCAVASWYLVERPFLKHHGSKRDGWKIRQ